MYLTSEKKAELFAKYGNDAKNTGSAESQIALFTFRINHLTEHLKENRKDFGTERALTAFFCVSLHPQRCMIEIKPYIEHAVLVGLITPNQPEERTKEYLDELAFLADTHGIVSVKRFTQRLNLPITATYVGEGKLDEIDQYIREHHPIDVVIFDDELSPRQIRNIEKALNHKGLPDVRVIDRTILILEIFLQRAQTSYAKTQVEMAHLQYMLPRLTRMWSHLDRQRGGGGTNRGMGETQIEADKRVIGQRIALLREQLKTIDKQMATQRQHRGKMVRVALVGYTNVGKSTLMNLLSKSDVFAENKLFATLDTTVRKVTVENLPFLLSDTVGFIRKLPHHLVESFKSTLDEVREADLLVHVVDISHPNFQQNRQFYLYPQGGRRPHAYSAREPLPGRPAEELDVPFGRGLHLHLRAQQRKYRCPPRTPLRAREGNTYKTISVQRFFVSEL